ncbi:hypothetical protein [Kribbella antibiotica]|uniref:hypothetical protein n=1 Tax=Kribbella antibiotica TaxID=190195 RepID=UPI00269FCBF5
MSPSVESGIELYWLPLGAGGRSVRWNGRVLERLLSWRDHRPADDLFHSALQVRARGQRFVIEMAPVWSNREPDRGVVCEGPVGFAWLGRSRYFRYEVRCWAGGQIPDVAEAVAGPTMVSQDENRAAALIDLIGSVPPLTWGRDELGAGDMWNSNSLTAWLLARTGHDLSTIHPPARGRAPGWNAGRILAARQPRSADDRDRAAGVVEDGQADGSEEQAGEAVAAAGADDQEFGVVGCGD